MQDVSLIIGWPVTFSQCWPAKEVHGGASLARGDDGKVPLGQRSQVQIQQSGLLRPQLVPCRSLRDSSSVHLQNQHVTVSHPKFEKDAMDVQLDRPGAQPQFASDFFIC